MTTARLADAPALHVEIDGPDPAAVPSPPTLCLVHGFGGSARNWRPQLRALRDRVRVAAFDVRGHARSEAPPDAASYAGECFVADVARVLDHLGIPRQPRARRDAAVIGGLSMGAGIAARFAAAHPERVRGLVLAALAPGARSPRRADEGGAHRQDEGGAHRQDEGGAHRQDEGGARQQSWALAFADAIERDGLEAAGARYAWGEESGFDPAAAKLIRLGFLEHPPHAVAHTLRQLLAQQPDWREIADSLQPLGVPLLIVVGERDRVSRGACEQLAKALPDAALIVVPGAGHVVNLEAREAVSTAIADFLAALPSDAESAAEPAR